MKTELEELTLRELGRRLMPGLTHKYLTRFTRTFTHDGYMLEEFGPNVLWAPSGVSVKTPEFGLQVGDIIEREYGLEPDGAQVRFVALSTEDYTIERVTVEVRRVNWSEYETMGQMFKVEDKESVNARIIRPPVWNVGDVHEAGAGLQYVVIWAGGEGTQHAILAAHHEGYASMCFQVAHATSLEEGDADWSNIAPNEDEFNTFTEAAAVYYDLIVSPTGHIYTLKNRHNPDEWLNDFTSFYSAFEYANELHTDEHFQTGPYHDTWQSNNFIIVRDQ